jgi:hypothetical protein
MPKRHQWFGRRGCYEVMDTQKDASVCICPTAALAALIAKLLNETEYEIVESSVNGE